jgi:hypothetical protein
MPNPRSVTALALATGLATGVMLLPTLAADGAPGRYTLTPADGGAFVRLDSQTGEVSICKRQDNQWACDAAADDRRALQTELDRLTTENKDLKSAVRRLEELAGLGESDPSKNSGKRAESQHPQFKLPTEQDIDQAVGYVQRMIKKLKDKLREFEEGGEPKSQKL